MRHTLIVLEKMGVWRSAWKVPRKQLVFAQVRQCQTLDEHLEQSQNMRSSAVGCRCRISGW